MCKDLVGRSLEHDAPAIEHDHAVRLDGLLHEMGHVHERGACLGEPAHHAQDGGAAAHVEERPGLVEHEHVGLHGERSGDGDALLLAAREAGGVRCGIVVERNAVQLASHARCDLFAREAEVLRPEGNVVLDDARYDLVVWVLEDEAEVAPGSAICLEVGAPV